MKIDSKFSMAGVALLAIVLQASCGLAHLVGIQDTVSNSAILIRRGNIETSLGLGRQAPSLPMKVDPAMHNWIPPKAKEWGEGKTHYLTLVRVNPDNANEKIVSGYWEDKDQNVDGRWSFTVVDGHARNWEASDAISKLSVRGTYPPDTKPPQQVLDV